MDVDSITNWSDMNLSQNFEIFNTIFFNLNSKIAKFEKLAN